MLLEIFTAFNIVIEINQVMLDIFRGMPINRINTLAAWQLPLDV